MFWKFKMTGYAVGLGDFEQEGLAHGDTMAEAVGMIESWYGDELCTLKIECVSESEDEPYVLNSKHELEDETREFDEQMEKVKSLFN